MINNNQEKEFYSNTHRNSFFTSSPQEQREAEIREEAFEVVYGIKKIEEKLKENTAYKNFTDEEKKAIWKKACTYVENKESEYDWGENCIVVEGKNFRELSDKDKTNIWYVIKNFIYWLLKTYYSKYYEIADDLAVAGFIGVAAHVKEFNIDVCEPTTFFKPYILSEINNYLKGENGYIEPYYYNTYKVVREFDNVSGLGNFDTEEDEKAFSKLTDNTISPDQVRTAVRAANISNSTPFCDIEDNGTLIADQSQSTEQEAIHSTLVTLINEAISGFKKDEQDIICYLFGLNGYTELSIGEVAKKLNITEDRVKYVKAKALKNLANNADLKSFYEG